MTDLTNIFARSIKDLTLLPQLPNDLTALDQVKIPVGNLPVGLNGCEALSVQQIRTIAYSAFNDDVRAIEEKVDSKLLGNQELVDSKLSETQELVDSKLLGNQELVDSKLLETKTTVESQLSENKTYTNQALSQLSTAANKFYPTLAEANAAIVNIAVNQPVSIGESVNGGLWYKATAEATTLTKSAYDPLTQAKADATTKADEARKYIDERVTRTASGNIHPIVADPKGNSPLWLDEGRLGFTELESSSQDRVKSQMGLGNFAVLNTIPIIVDPNGNCPLWIQKGLLNFTGIHPNAVQLIKEQFGDIDPQKKSNTTGASYPIISDGASLAQWKAKASRIKSGIAQQVRLLITGDSWTEHKTITNEILPLVRADLGEVGSGWVNLGVENNQVDNISVTKTGAWAYRDLDATSLFPHGSGPDGFILTSTAAGDTLTVSNLSKGNKLTVFYGKADGVFKYSINGGAETTITSSASGTAVQSTTIDVSADSNIVFTILSGTVVLFGLHLRKSTGSGVEVSKVGNGSCTGQDYLKISPSAQANFNDYLKPDLVIIILGTNDYRKGHSVENYKAGISAMIDGYRTNNPNCGFILIAPAHSNATPIIPLADFRDAVYEIAQEKKCEFYNMYDDWEVYSIENGNGMWNDSLHVSKSGAYRIAKKLFKNFLES